MKHHNSHHHSQRVEAEHHPSVSQEQNSQLEPWEIEMNKMTPRQVRAVFRQIAKEWKQEHPNGYLNDLDKEKSFDEKLAATSPADLRRGIREVAKEEQEKNKTFDQKLAEISPSQLRANMREAAVQQFEIEQQQRKLAEAKAIQEQKDRENSAALTQTEASKAKPMNMTYDKKSNSYITDDGYILPGPQLPAPDSDEARPSRAVLQNQLEKFADDEGEFAKHKDPNAPKRQKSLDMQLISLPDTRVDYNKMARYASNGSLYGPGGNQCDDSAVTAGITIWPFNRLGVTWAEPNKTCQLAQTVENVCASAELLSLDVANAGSKEEARRKAEIVRTAAAYCSETIDASKREQERLAQEKRDEEADEKDSDG